LILRLLAAAAAGAALAAAFAPLSLWWLAILSPAALFWLWQGATPRHAALVGFSYGAGTFSVGTYWLYISVHQFGEAPLGVALLLLIGLVAIMSLYFALLGQLVARLLPARGVLRWLVGLPAAWGFIEWWRGWFLSGFGWLSLGYSQTDTWLAALAPIGGVPLLSGLLLLMAGALVTLLLGNARERAVAAAALVVPWIAAFALRGVEWTRPSGDPVSVAIVQGAIPQDQKWQADNRDATLEIYRKLNKQVLGSRLIVWPEAAAPDLANNMVPYLRQLAGDLGPAGSELLIGVLRAERAGTERGSETQYFNSVLALGAEIGWYDKRHLVPFAEFFPVPGFVRSWLRMMSLPYSDFTHGAAQDVPLRAGGLSLAVTICYEDAYATSQLPMLRASDALVNVTNDAWFGRSSARHQHLQISRLRAIESQRFLLRAANDGISAVVDPRGRISARAPEFEASVLRAEIQPRSGQTPYMRTGNWPTILLFCALVGLAAVARRRWRA